MLYNSLGLSQRKQKTFEEAINTFKKSIKFGEKSGFEINFIAPLMNLASTYNLNSQTEFAIKTLKKSQRIAEKLNHSSKVCDCIIIIGDIYYRQNDFQNTLLYLKDNNQLVF